MSKDNTKQERKEKQMKFQEELRVKRNPARSKVCKITKALHVYNKPQVPFQDRKLRH